MGRFGVSMGFAMGSNRQLEAGGGGVDFGGDLGSLWGLLWDKMGSLRIEEVVLGLGGDLGSLWGLLGFALG